LSNGCSMPERAGGSMWRWTDGNAALPLHVAGPTILAVRLAGGVITLWMAGRRAGSKAPGGRDRGVGPMRAAHVVLV
jgi:hypothetical protein